MLGGLGLLARRRPTNAAFPPSEESSGLRARSFRLTVAGAAPDSHRLPLSALSATEAEYQRPPGHASKDLSSFNAADTRELWVRITCPTLLVRGAESWASNPLEDGRAGHFPNATVANIEKAGHWVHHDQLEVFLAIVTDFFRR